MVGSKDLAMYNKRIWKRFQLEAEKRKQQEEFKKKTQELVDRGNLHAIVFGKDCCITGVPKNVSSSHNTFLWDTQ